MQTKLQELTDKLYAEGLSKGREEGERILEQARAEAAGILENARKEAEAILADAERSARDLKSKAESDVKAASAQALSATKKDIENVLLSSTVSEQNKKVLSDPEVLKEMILAVARNFSATESTDLSLVLPESLKSSIEPWLKAELSKALSKGVKAEFSKKIAGGFTIGPADGSWIVSLTDETFENLVCEYLRPVTKKVLFG